MLKLVRNIIGVLTLLLLVVSCAKIITLEGGPVDETPPTVVKTIPKDLETHYKENKVYLFFNEYVTVKNFNQEFKMIPRPKKVKVKPSNVASKKLTIVFDPLPGVSTYEMNFGHSIQDYNEGNILKDFKLTFSSSDRLDSGVINGTIIADTIGSTTQKDKLIALLYPIDENSSFKNEDILKKPAPYIQKISKDFTFSFNHIPKQFYKLIVIEDINKNNLYDSNKEHIGFIKSLIYADTIKNRTIVLFKPTPKLLFKESSQSKGKIRLIYTNISPKNSFSPQLLNYNKGLYKLIRKADPVNNQTYFDFWYVNKDPEKVKQLRFKTSANDTITINLKNNLDSLPNLSISADTILYHNKHLVLKSNEIPIERINPSKIKLSSKGKSLKVKSHLSNESIEILFDKKEDTQYEISLLPGAITDFFGTQNTETIAHSFKTIALSEYGNFKFNLTKSASKPLTLVLRSDNLEFKAILEKGEKTTVFKNIPPQDYELTLFSDSNKNGRWDNGDFFNSQQPEKKYTYSKIVVKPGETTTLTKQN